jgi:hypothetical protein
MHWSRLAAAGGWTLGLAIATSGCGAIASMAQGLPDRPSNDKAIPPIVLVAEASSPGGEYRAWIYNTSDGMTCLEERHREGGGSGCGPLGDDPGPGRGASDKLVIVNASTRQPSAVKAVFHDANGPDVTVSVSSADPVLPGLRIAVAGFATTANPRSVDFIDGGGKTVEHVDLP